MGRELLHSSRSIRVSLRDARRVIAAGEAAASAADLSLHFVVLDGDGDLVAHARMDGAWGPDTAMLQRTVEQAGSALAGGAGRLLRFVSIDHGHRRHSVFVAAEPLWCGETVVGAVGVSGLSGDLDRTIAPAAAKAFP